MTIDKENLQNLTTSISSCKDFSFEDTLEVEDVMNALGIIQDYEQREQTIIEISMKKLSFDKRVEILRRCMNDENTSNISIISNIIFLLRNYNSFSDSFFNDDKTMFNSMTEFLDMKIGLKVAIEEFIEKLSTWYVSTILSMHKVEINQFDDVKVMPNLVKILILSTDMFTLSGICSKCKFKDGFHAFIVDSAFDIIGELTRKNNFISEMYVDILKRIKDRNGTEA